MGCFDLLVEAPVLAGGSDLARPTGMAAPERICARSARADVAGILPGTRENKWDGRPIPRPVVASPQGVPMGHTVLVVDDDYAVRRVIELRFQLDDYDVVSTGESEDAVRLAGERRPDAIILDVMMPGMDGFEICRRVRAAQ